MELVKVSQIQVNDFTRAIRYLYRSYVKEVEVPQPVCDLIYRKYRHLSIENLETAFKRGAAGEYEKIYSPPEVINWLSRFAETLSPIPQRRSISLEPFSTQDKMNILQRGFAYESEILRYKITNSLTYQDAVRCLTQSLSEVSLSGS